MLLKAAVREKEAVLTSCGRLQFTVCPVCCTAILSELTEQERKGSCLDLNQNTVLDPFLCISYKLISINSTHMPNEQFQLGGYSGLFGDEIIRFIFVHYFELREH